MAGLEVGGVRVFDVKDLLPGARVPPGPATFTITGVRANKVVVR